MDRYQEVQEMADRLWSDLFSDRKFYAFQFERNQKILDTPVHFHCPEAYFAVTIEYSPSREEIKMRNELKRNIESAGYKMVVLSYREIKQQYSDVVKLLDHEFISHTRFQCG